MRMSIKAAVVAAASTALLVPAAAAFAGSATVADSTGDTWIQNDDGTFTKSDETVNADLAKVNVKHGAQRVTIVAHFTSLSRGGMNPFVATRLRTDQGLPYDVFMSGYNDGSKWHFDGVAFHEGSQNPGAAKCQSLDTSVDWTADTLTVIAPRSCLGDPAWVEAHVEATGNYQASDGSYVNVFDNGHNDTHNSKGWTAKIKKG